MSSGSTGHVEHSSNFPWSHIVGYVLSIVLTLVALWMVLNHTFSNRTLMVIILVLGVAQIFVQLFFFMHITEPQEGPRYNLIGVGLGALFAIAVIGGSIWIMSFGGNQAY